MESSILGFLVGFASFQIAFNLGIVLYFMRTWKKEEEFRKKVFKLLKKLEECS